MYMYIYIDGLRKIFLLCYLHGYTLATRFSMRISVIISLNLTQIIALTFIVTFASIESDNYKSL